MFVLGAAFFSVQAQQDKGGISSEMLDQIRQSYQGTSADKALGAATNPPAAQIKRCAMPSATTISVNSPSIRRT